MIPARNSAEVLPQQLAALAAQDSEVPWEVVVADNGSTDATAALVAAATSSFPVPLRLIDASRRRGANAARNEGIRAAAGTVVLFCDSDDVVDPGWVRAMIAGLDDAATAGGPLAFELLNAPATRLRAFDRPSSIQRYRTFEYALTANFGVRREVFDRVGLFDERFVLGFDEVDFGYRAHRAGFALHDVRDAVVHYRLRAGRRALVRQQYQYGLGSRIFLDKYPELADPREDPFARRLIAVAREGVKLAARAVGPRDVRDRHLGRFVYACGSLGRPGNLARARAVTSVRTAERTAP